MSHSYYFNQFLQQLSQERTPQTQDEDVKSLFDQIESWLEGATYGNYEYQREDNCIKIICPILCDPISVFLNGRGQIVAKYKEYAQGIFHNANSKWVCSVRGLYGHYHVDAEPASFFLALQRLIESVCKVPR